MSLRGLDRPNIFYGLAEVGGSRHPEIEAVCIESLGRQLEIDDLFAIEELVAWASTAVLVTSSLTNHSIDMPLAVRVRSQPLDFPPVLHQVLQRVSAGSWGTVRSIKRRRLKVCDIQGIRRKLIDFALAAEMPVLAEMENAADKDHFAQRICGTYREKTLVRRLRDVQLIAEWSRSALAKAWPPSHVSVIMLLEEQAAIPCAVTVPKRLVTAINFLEALGGVLEANRIYTNVFVTRTLQSIHSDLTANAGGATFRKKANQLPVAVLMALEHTVTSSHDAAYIRVSAWTRLLRHWLALRWDDTMHMSPSKAKFDKNSGVLTVIIEQTKTTGVGKKVELLTAWVCRDAWLLHETWLEDGWRLFTGLNEEPRTYWLPLPTADLQAFAKTDRAEITYAKAASAGRALLASLRVSHGTESKDGPEEMLLAKGVQALWTLHGDRATLNSWAACKDYSKETRQALGRWSADGSDEYIRTSRSIVLSTQRELAKFIRLDAKPDDLGEPDLYDKVNLFMLDHGFEGTEIADQIDRLQAAFGGVHPAPGPNDESSDSAERLLTRCSDTESDGFEPVPKSLLRELQHYSDPSASESELRSKDRLPNGTWVVSRREGSAARTLHRIGSGKCHRVPGLHYRLYEIVHLGNGGKEHTELEVIAMFDRPCKDCFGHMLIRDKAPSVEDASSDTLSSSSS